MTTKSVGDELKGKGRVRATVRRGSKSGRLPPVARKTGTLRGTTMCERCGGLYREKQWHRPTPVQLRWPVGLVWTICPACRQAQAGEYYGKVIIRGDAAERDEPAIRRRLEHIAARAQWTQPLRRIISIERRGRDLEILTTSQKLAHRIVRSMAAAFGGDSTYGWSGEDGELRATWTWEGSATASTI